MIRKRSWLVDFAAYCAVRVMVSIAQALSWSQAQSLAGWLAWLVYRLNRRHRQVALENVAHAFPELSEIERDQLVRACYRHWIRVAIEIMRLPRFLRKENLPEYFDYPTMEDFHVADAFSSTDRPCLLVTGHFGNFEALSYGIGLYGPTGAIIARRLDNPYLDRFLREFRQRTGQEILDKNLDYERVLEQLRQGGKVGMVGDQDAGPRGLFVDFLGRPASTFKSIALLALEFQTPILVMGAARIGDPFKYRIYLEDVIDPAEYANHPDPTRAITQRYSDALARMVRRHPEQYFWLHRRWKHQPKAAKKAA